MSAHEPCYDIVTTFLKAAKQMLESAPVGYVSVLHSSDMTGRFCSENHFTRSNQVSDTELETADSLNYTV